MGYNFSKFNNHPKLLQLLQEVNPYITKVEWFNQDHFGGYFNLYAKGDNNDGYVGILTLAHVCQMVATKCKNDADPQSSWYWGCFDYHDLGGWDKDRFDVDEHHDVFKVLGDALSNGLNELRTII